MLMFWRIRLLGGNRVARLVFIRKSNVSVHGNCHMREVVRLHGDDNRNETHRWCLFFFDAVNATASLRRLHSFR